MFLQSFGKIFYKKTFINSVSRYSIKNARRRANPGIDNQSKMLESKDDAQEIGDFDELESDFMEVHKSHKQFEQESEELRERTRHWVVKNKYFKNKLPNFLTFAEKEQIKLLNSRDPQEWNEEKLAESFPATVDIIKKIIRAKWMPRSRERIRKHDESVMQNWKTLNINGFPELTESIKGHLKKFSARRKEDLIQNTAIHSDWSPRPALPRPNTTEFLSIITSCNQIKNSSETPKMLANDLGINSSNPIARSSNLEDETFLNDKVADKRYMRLKEFEMSKLKPLNSSANILGQDEPVNDETNIVNNPFNTSNISSKKISIASNEDCKITKHFNNNEVIVSEHDCKKYEMTTIKDQIYIPKKLWRKGATFKVEDCYYDDDGSFLYRVPGMTGRMA